MAYPVNYHTPTKQEMDGSDRGIKPFNRPEFERNPSEE
jgi:hypothetical protein